MELDEELEIASRTTNSFAESLNIFSRRLEGGTASSLESSRAEAALDDAAAALPAIRQRISVTENQLSVLLGRILGRFVGSILIHNGKKCCRRFPAGLPSALLERRPDIRRARTIVALRQRANRRIHRRILSENRTDRVAGKGQPGTIGIHCWQCECLGHCRRRNRPIVSRWPTCRTIPSVKCSAGGYETPIPTNHSHRVPGSIGCPCHARTVGRNS